MSIHQWKISYKFILRWKNIYLHRSRPASIKQISRQHGTINPQLIQLQLTICGDCIAFSRHDEGQKASVPLLSKVFTLGSTPSPAACISSAEAPCQHPSQVLAHEAQRVCYSQRAGTFAYNFFLHRTDKTKPIHTRPIHLVRSAPTFSIDSHYPTCLKALSLLFLSEPPHTIRPDTLKVLMRV